MTSASADPPRTAERAARRRSGRRDARSEGELERRIVDAASRVFRAEGFNGASMDLVAQTAGTGKQTIYRRFASKEDLFGAVIERMCASLADMPHGQTEDTSDQDLLSPIRAKGMAALEFIMRDEALGTYRLLIGEGARFAELVPPILTPGDAFHTRLLRPLQDAEAAGQIRPGLADSMTIWILFGLLTGWTLQQALLGGDGLRDPAIRAQFFERAWAIFLHGVS